MNGAALLIPARKRLWHKVDTAGPLFAPANGGGHAGTVVTGKRGKPVRSKSYDLAFRECPTINSALSDEVDLSGAAVLRCNQEPPRVFNGQFPRHAGFVLTPAEAKALLRDDPRNREVVHPFLIGAEMLTHGQPQRWVIDFQKLDVLAARAYAAPFRTITETVLPHVQGLAAVERGKTGKDSGQDQNWLRMWWQHFRCRKELVDAIAGLPRYLACCEVTKRPIFCFVESAIRPDHTLEVFPLADDYSFGILQSDAHWQWFTAKCSKLTERFRYTPESVFDTFPWPQFPGAPPAGQVEAVAAAGREVRRVRSPACTCGALRGGLRALYRTVELPGENPLKDAHAALDEAVRAAYGFAPGKGDDPLAALLELNRDVARRLAAGEAVTAPGVPVGYPEPRKLVSADCIRPG